MRRKTVCVLSDAGGPPPAALLPERWKNASLTLTGATYGSVPGCDALLLTDTVRPGGLTGAVRALRTSGFSGPIAALSDSHDFFLLRQLMREGVCDFLPLPPSAQDVDGAIKRLLARLPGTDGTPPPGDGETHVAAVLSQTGATLPELGGLGMRVRAARDGGLYCFGGADLEQRLSLALRERPGWFALCCAPAEGCDLARLRRRAALAACDRLLYPDQQLFLPRRAPAEGATALRKALMRALTRRDQAQFDALLRDAPNHLRGCGAGMSDVARLWNALTLALNDQYAGTSLEFMRPEALCARFSRLEMLFEALQQAFRPLFDTGFTGPVNEQFLSLLNYVNRHAEEPLSLSELADRHHLNLSYCSELFRKVTGANFSSYLTRLRMERASLLYQSGLYPPQDIYRLVGYNDAYYFSRCYRKYLSNGAER